MAGRIPQDFIDSLIARSDIVEVIDERVPLKKAGREYEACCPFHGEKTPSFKVSPNKQFYHCFGCGAHGTVVGFLMDYERMEFREVVEMLAERAGMPIPEGARSGPGEDYRALYDILEQAAAFYRQQLREHPQAATAVDYLKGRGLTGVVAREFGLGFAPPGWDNLHKALGADDATAQVMKTAGLAVDRNNGGTYDRFRNRIMFPIQDRRGRVIGFGGRVLEAEDTPKYLNSPETPVFHKGRELYGRWQAVRRGGRLNRLVVVEGYMDVVALAQHGIHNSVASLGTAATPEHLESLFRLTPEVVFCFDGDAAGKRAAWRALENALPQMKDGRRALFMFLPEGEDPDSLVRGQGADAFNRLAGEATNLSDYLFEHLSEELDLSSIEGQSRLHELARPLLEKLPDGVFKTLTYNRLSQLTGVAPPETQRAASQGPAYEVAGAVGGARGGRSWAGAGGREPARGRGGPARTGSGSLVRRTIALLMHQVSLAARVEPAQCQELRDLVQPGSELLAELVDLLQANPNLVSGAVVDRYREHPTGKHLAALVAQPIELEDGLEQEFDDCIRSLLRNDDRERQTARLRALTAKGPALTAAEKNELRELTLSLRS